MKTQKLPDLRSKIKDTFPTASDSLLVMCLTVLGVTALIVAKGIIIPGMMILFLFELLNTKLEDDI